METEQKPEDSPVTAVCPNPAGWTAAPLPTHSPLKTMSWANDLPKDKFGCTRNSGAKFHGGIDLKADVGTECYATEDCVVKDVGFGTELGTYVGISFKKGGTTYGVGYCHLSETSVSIGDNLKAGSKLGKTGKSGNVGTDTPHLHLEVHNKVWAGYSDDAARSAVSLNPNGYV